MASSKTQPARGMRDFLPADVRRREYVIGIIKEVYERYGFEPLETPAVENIETLMGKYGEEGNQLIFKILKRGVHEKTGEADLALRYDLTVPLARVVAQYQNELPKFFKRYQIQPVWRADRPARGRFREFYQCDVDILGSRSMVVEAELIAAASDALVALGFNDFTIRLNHRQLLTRILMASGVPEAKHTDALIMIDKLDKIGRDAGEKELVERHVPIVAVNRLFEFLRKFFEQSSERAAESWDFLGAKWKGNPLTWLELNHFLTEQISEFIAGDEREVKGISELRAILELLENTTARDRVEIDPTLARGLSYYTGAIMEITMKGVPGSLGGGGRYDNLVGMFLERDVPACGFSLGLERIIVVMKERDMFPAHLLTSPADVMMTIWDQDSLSDSIEMANKLRAMGLRVQLYPEPDKLSKQFKYAAAVGIPFVVVVGPDEKRQSVVTLRDLRSSSQLGLPTEVAASLIRESLAKQPPAALAMIPIELTVGFAFNPDSLKAHFNRQLRKTKERS